MRVLVRRWLLMLLMLGLMPGVGISIARADTSAGRLVDFKGDVRLQPPVAAGWRSPVVGESLLPGTIIETAGDGWAAILMADESLVQLSKHTRFELTRTAPTAGWNRIRGVVPAAGARGGGSVYRMERGKLWLRNKKRQPSIDIHTPTVSATIRGTELVVAVRPDRSVSIDVLEGWVRAWNAYGELGAIAGEVIDTRPGEAPTKRMLLTPADAVQWTLVMPTIGQVVSATTSVVPPSDLLGQALADFKAKAYSAAAGKFDRYRTQFPQDPVPWRYMALIALVQNRPTDALAAAKAAVTRSVDDPLDWLVLAYAHQAGFDLDQALAAVDQALVLDPSHATALLVKARLLFAMDRTAAAEAILAKAEATDPDNGEILNLRGFIALAAAETRAAEAAFTKATMRSPGLGEPHLGLALTAMRRADEATAMEQISTAVLLEPQRSLFLSYWAKMLYQLKRFDRALELLDQAIRLDPNDPTPLLYKSLILRDLNTPTAAVAALNAAMQKNDNRAVYRSRFLLDRDAAVKNVNLSIVYNQLGLPEWAKNKALASVKQDYTNASGHIFLAGALLAQDARSRAAASENAFGTLVQPANVNALNSFNEYTSFFDKPYWEGALAGSLGNHDSWGASGFVAGAVPGWRTAFSVLGSRAHTDGWRGTDHQDRNGLNGRLKIDPTIYDGVLLSASHSEADTMGNILLEPNEIDAPPRMGDRWDSTSRRYTLGYHRRLLPEVTALAYAQRRDGDFDALAQSQQFFGPDVRADIDTRDLIERVEDQAQGLIIFQKQEHQLIAGALAYRRRNDRDTVSTYQYSIWNGSDWLPVEAATETFTSGGEHTDRFTSLHLQDIWQPLPHLTVEGAVYWERIDRLNPSDRHQWTDTEVLPRLGIVWTPRAGDTIRLAAFRYLVPYAFERIDPQDIAGVTISRNTYEGALSEEADLVWEHEWGRGLLSANLFYLESIDTWQFADGRRREWKTRIVGLENAWNQMLVDGMGLRAIYRYLDVDDEFLPANKRRDHLAALALTHVAPWGLRLGASQGFRFLNFAADGRGDEEIWLTDLSAGFDLPGKRGNVSLAVYNLFDNQFNWVQDPFVLQGRAPAREIVATLAVYF